MNESKEGGEVFVAYVRINEAQHAKWTARAATIDRPLAWWIRAVCDWAALNGVGDPRQLHLPGLEPTEPRMPFDASDVTAATAATAADLRGLRDKAKAKAKAKANRGPAPKPQRKIRGRK